MTTRRTPLALIAALAVALLALAGCGTSSSGSTDTGANAAGDGPWTYTDDLGTTIKLDHTPTRIAGLTDPLVSLMNYGIEPVAAFGWSTVGKDPRFANFDVSGIATLGATYGEIDEEKLITAAPDLIVTTTYPTDEKGTIDTSQPDYGFNDKAQEAKIAKIAPILVIKMGGQGADVIASQAKLALALGASQSTVEEAKTTYDTAATQLKTAAAASKVTVTVMYGDADGAYVVKPEDEPITELYQELGVKFFQPTPKGYYWGIYSWENAGRIGGDLVLLQKDGYSKEEMLKQATLAQTPAFKAGQIQPFTSPGLDYVSQAGYMTDLAGYLAGAKVLTR